MTFTKERFIPLPSNWLSLDIEYQGSGQAHFLDPKGTVQGKTSIRFNELGEGSIEMEVGDFQTEQPLDFGLIGLLSGNKSVQVRGTKALGLGTRNSCTALKVTTPEGILSASDHIHYNFTIAASGSKINFSVLSPRFVITDAKKAKYWVIPLSNFISNFRRNHPILDNHPLRIFPTPIVPKDLPEQDKMNATLVANQKNRLITFMFDESPGFIEPLTDFDKRKDTLLSGQALNRVTAVMVGEIGSNSIEFDSLNDWFPYDFIPLLGMASGIEVGMPWIEFRDAEGKLVSRIHSSLERPLFSKGHAAINDNIHHGTGYLLTKAQSSPKYNQSFLRVVMKNMVQAGLYNIPIEDKLRHLFLVFENLIEEYGIAKTQSLKKKNKDLVDEKVKELNKFINDIARQVQENGDLPEAEILRRMVKQISNAKTVRTGFAPNVKDLMKKFKLPDSDIISQHYAENPRSDKRKWIDVIPYYRAILMHRSYFEFREGKHDIDDVSRIFNHLHDILVRIILNILGYDGTYQPIVESMTINQPIDWVKPDTPASRLGY